MFRHRQQLRRWAALTLLVWLFGIATAVAQACLAPSPMQWTEQQSDPATAVGAEHAMAAAPASGIHQESHPPQHEGVVGHDGALNKSNCEDFCEKSATAMPSLKSALDNVQGHALPPAGVAAVCPLPAAAPAQLSVPRRDGALAPPIRLAFVRLAL